MGKLSMVVHACYFSTAEVEAKGLQVQSQSWVQSETLAQIQTNKKLIPQNMDK
jgi:hypothetical protein